MPKKKDNKTMPLGRVFHIYCEGKETEPNYLKGYIADRVPNELRRLFKLESTEKNTPVQLVDEAITKKSEVNSKSDTEDTFWVVYDRESPQKYSDELHDKAMRKAKKHGIHIALSNVCFEVWILLHFQDTVAQYLDYDNLKRNSPLRDKFREAGFSDYDKAEDSFKILSVHVDEARKRAKHLNENTQNCADSSDNKPYQFNPYTDVYNLLDMIDKWVCEENEKKSG
ncbi:MAG: hypothetical protein RL368_2022 [Pseudomonadota bacterium]|jgi:hypothetical protein